MVTVLSAASFADSSNTVNEENSSEYYTMKNGKSSIRNENGEFVVSTSSDNNETSSILTSKGLVLKEQISYGTKRVIYEINMPKGGYMDYIADPKEDIDNIVVYNKDNVAIGGFSNSIVIDKNKNVTNTELEIQGNCVIQKLPANSNNLNVSRSEITASSLSYSHFYKSSKWIIRKGKEYPLSLHIDTKPNAQWDFVQVAWDVLKNKHYKSKNWSNTTGMYRQWYCHLTTVGHFKKWNLEPKRPNKSLPKTIACKCNPR